MIEGLVLGLANGTACLAYCAPVILPYLLGQASRPLQDARMLGEFLLGRLAGYLVFGLLAGAAGRLLSAGDSVARGRVLGLVYVLLSVLLVTYGLSRKSTACAAKTSGIARLGARLPLFFGLMTGLSLCPPFLLALTAAAGTGSISGSVLFFVMFFVGTSVYLVPLPLVGGLRRFQTLQIVGKFAAAIMGLYYFFLGSTLLYGGMTK